MSSAVVGLGFGDEGKGVVVDYLCSRKPESTVLRFSGGHQAAHTVTLEDTSHVFSNFGSGTLRGCPTYWSEFCTVEPRGLWKELEVLKSKGVTPKIHIHGNCRVTTPYDIVANWLSKERNHGTCGVGIWKTIERARRGVTITASDVFENFQAGNRLKEVKDYYGGLHHEDLQPMLEEFYYSVLQILGSSVQLFTDYPRENLVFEGSQGLLLDEDLGFSPHTTPSKTNLDNLFTLGYIPSSVYLVTRAYQTRHGAGPMTNQDLPVDVQRYEEATQYNPFQGSLRKTVLDLNLLANVVSKGMDYPDVTRHLVVTCLDQVERYKLTYNGNVMTFVDPTRFASFIGEVLKVDGSIYGNFSPRSSTVRLLKTSKP